MLVFSHRHLSQPVWQAGQHEFEDVIASINRADVISPAGRRATVAAAWATRPADQARQVVGAPRAAPVFGEPLMDEVEVDGEYDLFFHFAHTHWQLAYLNQLKGWRSRARRAVCFIVEAYSP